MSPAARLDHSLGGYVLKPAHPVGTSGEVRGTVRADPDPAAVALRSAAWAQGRNRTC